MQTETTIQAHGGHQTLTAGYGSECESHNLDHAQSVSDPDSNPQHYEYALLKT
jgi:hypothetical protein